MSQTFDEMLPAMLQKLRTQRGLIDQAITALEFIAGERPLPDPLVRGEIVEPARQPKLLKAARRVKQAKKKRKASPPPSEGSVGKRLREHNETYVVEIVREAGGSITPRELMTRLKLNNLVAVRARTAPLLKARKLIAIGATLNRRLALPESAKEAP